MNSFINPLKITAMTCAAITAGLPYSPQATITGFSSCVDANSCVVTTTPPNVNTTQNKQLFAEWLK